MSSTPAPRAAAAVDFAAPALRRRLACLAYESVLLFAVVFFSALLYSVLTGQRHAMSGRIGLAWVAFVLAPALYCTWYWSQTGQTLPMQTWRIRVVTAAGGRLTRAHAALRFGACWLWFLPPLALAWLMGWQANGRLIVISGLAWAVLYALSCRLHPSRQFWHDLACGTRLIDIRGPDTGGPAPRPG